MLNDTEQDLRARWLPSKEQMAMADALLRAGFDQDRQGEWSTERGVWTGHVLVNKRFGWWNTDVVVEFVDGVFLTREGASQAAKRGAELAHQRTGLPTTGGYAWHSRVGEAAVWEDIAAQYAPEDTGWSARTQEVHDLMKMGHSVDEATALVDETTKEDR